MKPVATNQKAFRNFFLLDTWECGIVLTGAEIKSVRAGFVNFKGSYARVDDGEIRLYNLFINPYKEASYLNTEPDRPRKLLLHRREITRIDNRIRERSEILVPTKLYFTKRGLLKVELALARGKKLYDKRADIKDRDVKRDLKRAVKARA